MSEQLATKIYADDLLVALSHYLPPERRCFRRDRKVHSFLCRKKQEYPALLRDFFFDTNHIEPYSEELEQAISTLSACGLLVVASNKPWDYHFSPEAEQSFQRFVSSRISQQSMADLERLAAEFNREVAIDASVSFR